MKHFSFILLLTIVACSSGLKGDKQASISIDDYWFQGKAELTSYHLKQARYGEVHEGEAVLIFVTEDFSKKKNVKLDNPSEHPEDRLPVMKLNMTKKFYTGVYPYSMMLSTFTPYKKPDHLTKLTATSQEWCGHTFTQLAEKGNKYDVELYSYFESEGDQSLSLDKVVLEDELWSLIRIDPSLLPTGEFELIPGMLFQRLKHIPIKKTRASATVKDSGDRYSVYTVSIPEFNRELSIKYEKSSPYKIFGWTETYISGFGDSEKKLVTKATLNERLMLDYWDKNEVADSTYRKKLNIKAY